VSDRERAGFRGPVRTVSEGSTKTEYDLAGRLISQRWLSNPDSEASETIRTLTYDGSGRLLAETVRTGSGILSDKVYSYDDKGRLLRLAEGSGDHTSFQYDEQGHKIEVLDVAERPDDRNRAAAIGVDVIFADPEGTEFDRDRTGSASRIKTIYNEHDRPTETQAYDADGLVLSRIVRTYDEKQRITDLRVVNEDPTSLLSAKQMAEMAAQSGAPLDEIKAQVKKAFGAMMGDSGRSFTYDSQGRRTKIVLHQGFADVSRTYNYNDHGDVVEERTIFTQNPKVPVGVVFQSDESGSLVPEKPSSEWPPQPDWPESVVHYTYQYDSYGNWIEQTQTRSEGWEHTSRRELTYY
jgi:YD repeat-containing protein